MGGVDLGSATGDEPAAPVTELRGLVDALEEGEADLLHRFKQAEGFKDAGFASLAGWERSMLRWIPAKPNAGPCRSYGRTACVGGRGVALGRDPVVARGAARRRATKAGVKVMTGVPEWLLPVARTCDRRVLKGLVDQLVDVVDPERLDQDYDRGGQNRQLARCGDGLHVTGFLGVSTGVAFKAWLDSAAAPSDADDSRAPQCASWSASCSSTARRTTGVYVRSGTSSPTCRL